MSMIYLYICLSLSVQGPSEADKQQGPPLGVSHFEQLRNLPYASEGWQPPQHLLQQQQLIPGHDWPSAFAPAPRYNLIPIIIIIIIIVI